MALDPQALRQLQLDLEEARRQFAALQLDPGIPLETKLLANAIMAVGTEIAISVATRG
jgi:hypothetical protein